MKTINELLEEFNDPPFTAVDFAREKMILLAEFRLKYALNNEKDIHEAIVTHRLPCMNTLVEKWVSLMAFAPYMDGICKYCSATVPIECNCCASCADERGP